MSSRKKMVLCALAAIALSAWVSGAAGALEKEMSLLAIKQPTLLATKQPMGDLAVAGRLSIDLHAEFMVSRTYEKDTVLNWYNCGYSGGGSTGQQGGDFGDFGFQVPFKERDLKYPHAVTIDKVRAVKFDGNDFMTGRFEVEKKIAGAQNMAIEVWVRSENPSKDEVILGWQSKDGKETSAPLGFSEKFTGSEKWRHIVVNCTPDKEDWYLDGVKVSSGARKMIVKAGHRMVLGGASAANPSFKGDLVAVRLHDEAMTEEEIAHNFTGGVMLGTEMHSWWRTETEPIKWWVKESEHFRHCVDPAEMEKWTEQQTKEFNDRVPQMFNMAELIYHTYSERLAMRSSVVSVLPEERGDGIKYKIGIQPSNGSWMGWDGHFGWACQGAGGINPHELVHGWDAQTGGMQGNYWEAHANFPQTYNGIHQTIPVIAAECSAFPASGRTYYHDRTMFEHLAQTPEYGPMFIAKMWYDGPSDTDKSDYPWLAFSRINPYPERTLAEEFTKMAMKNVTYDYTTFADAQGGKGNTPYGNDGVAEPESRYHKAAENMKADINRYARIILEKIPYEPEWWRVPKEQAPQQLGWNICPLRFKPGKVTATLVGYVDPKRGSDWRAGFVGVDVNGKPVYGEVFGPKKAQSFAVGADIKELYLVVVGTPTIIPIDMTGDFRSFEQEQFPYKVKFTGCEPLDVMVTAKPDVAGAAHANGGGFVESTAQVDASAYVGPNAQVLGRSKVLGNARIGDYAVIQNATVQDNAVVCGHAMVREDSIIAENAKVRGFAVVKGQTTVKGNAKILEHGAIFTKKICSDNVVVKGVASVYGGSQSGTAMIDGFYAKGNEITKGKWFTWSWGQGKNPGEIDEDFGGLYADYTFEEDHGPITTDKFGATWGYLVGSPKLEVVPERVTANPAPAAPAKPDEKAAAAPAAPSVPGQVLVLNGKDQFVELPEDVSDMRSCTYTAEFKWNGKDGARIFEFANSNGDAVWLSPSEKGKLVFAIRKGNTVAKVSAPAVKKGVWTKVQVIVNGTYTALYVNGKNVADNPGMSLTPDSIRADQCYLGRGLKGGFFGGMIGRFTVSSVPLKLGQ
ncbi:MAG: DUF6055 domain-containing protein [Armatimonadetes bacterium]|nr:DUF6055 domain-containing protein [Armatimonadota bacterium]